MRKIHNADFVREVEPEYDVFMRRAEEVRWSPDAIPYHRIDRSKLTEADLFAVFVTLHIENYSDVYTKLLVEEYRDLPLIQKFVLNWEKEEENHARALERYMTTLGIPLDELRANYAKVDKGDFPVPTRNQTGLNVFVYLQELFTREMYVKILKSAQEPVLREILRRVVRDEERHYRFYRDTLWLRMKLDKSDTLRQIRTIVRTFGMPQTMFRQTAMTDKLMEYYRYGFGEMSAIAAPIVKLLEASPSRLFAKFPRLQRLWQLRRAIVYFPQSPYLWAHVRLSLRAMLRLGTTPPAEREYVDAVVARLARLLEKPDQVFLPSSGVAAHS